jgi:hypothetical protein
MPLLECVGLVKDFPDKRAIDNVGFHVEQGGIVNTRWTIEALYDAVMAE